MSTSDDLVNKRKQSLAQEKKIDAYPRGHHWQLGSDNLARSLEKMLGLASIPLVFFGSFIFLCFTIGISLFLGLCRLAAAALKLFNPRTHP
jgi:hypothetical protein